MTKVTFHCPLLHSKKNRGKIVRLKGGRRIWRPSDTVRSQRTALRAQFHGTFFHAPENDVAIEVEYSIGAKQLRVCVRDLGAVTRDASGKSTGRRRDLHGMLEALCDALEGVLYKNDNQVAEIVMRKVP